MWTECVSIEEHEEQECLDCVEVGESFFEKRALYSAVKGLQIWASLVKRTQISRQDTLSQENHKSKCKCKHSYKSPV